MWADYTMREKFTDSVISQRGIAEIGRIQDWVYLDKTNRNLTNKLYKIGQDVCHILATTLLPISNRLGDRSLIMTWGGSAN